MRLELLHIEGCPHTLTALERLKAALAALDLTDMVICSRILGSSIDTVGTEFAGSPTITLDGVDIFSEGTPSSDLACRIYRTPSGYAGAPTVEQLVEALTNHGLQNRLPKV